MRISSDENDEGYPQFRVAMLNGKKLMIFLDGEEISASCTVADTDQGFVERCVLDADGFLQFDPVDTKKIWMERVTGNVEVRFE